MAEQILGWEVNYLLCFPVRNSQADNSHGPKGMAWMATIARDCAFGQRSSRISERFASLCLRMLLFLSTFLSEVEYGGEGSVVFEKEELLNRFLL